MKSVDKIFFNSTAEISLTHIAVFQVQIIHNTSVCLNQLIILGISNKDKIIKILIKLF